MPIAGPHAGDRRDCGGSLSPLKRRGLAGIRYVGLIAAPEGVARLNREHPDVPMYVAALDDGPDERGLILPGLGDARDRRYGTEYMPPAAPRPAGRLLRRRASR